ncbi:MAG TPA: hypothetical protein DCP63_09900 [Bacteroidetes bacterium]|nr:hypothetical protein [Bacteroidota bacterium]
MNRIANVLVLFLFAGVSAFSQTRGVKVVEMEDEKGQKFVAYENSYAFIVGINKYIDPKIPALNYAVQDANAIAGLLESLDFPKENIKIILNEEATLARIKEEFSIMGSRTKKNDRLLVYWAGHGESEVSARGGEMGYLLPHDGKVSSMYSTCLSMDEVKRMTELVAAKHVFYLVDACYGGLSAVTSRSLSRQTEAYLQKVTSAEAVQIITAGTKDEQVVESPTWGHSAFTKAILDGFATRLADSDNNNVVTADELYSYLQSKVFELSRSEHPKGHRPVFANLRASEGQFAFVVSVPEFTLSLLGLPATNTVYMNGKKFSENKEVVREKLRSGNYNIEIDAPGRERFSTTVDLSSDRELTPRMKSTTISYTLETSPSGASVKIDNVDAGLSPVKKELTLGQHRIEIRKEGYDPMVYTTAVSDQNNYETKELKVKLLDISVVSTPRGAQIYLNDLPQGQTPYTIQVRPGAKYTVELQWEGKKLSTAFQATGAGGVAADFDAGVINFSGAGKVLDAKAEEKPAVPPPVIAQPITQPTVKKEPPKETAPPPSYVEIDLDPKDAKVTIDGKTVIPASGKIEVKPGRRLIRATKDGYEEAEFTADVQPGETKRIPLKMAIESSSSSWLYYVGGVAVLGGAAAYLLGKAKTTDKTAADPYGSPPAFPVNQ